MLLNWCLSVLLYAPPGMCMYHNRPLPPSPVLPYPPIQVLPFSLMFCTCIYIITAVAGYVRFAGATKGDILLNFDADGKASWQGDSSKLLMALHVVLAYPVVLFPALRAIDSEFPNTCGGLNKGQTTFRSLVIEGTRYATTA